MDGTLPLEERVLSHITEAETLVAGSAGLPAAEAETRLRRAEGHCTVAQALVAYGVWRNSAALGETMQGMSRDTKGQMSAVMDIFGRIAPPPEEPFPTV